MTWLNDVRGNHIYCKRYIYITAKKIICYSSCFEYLVVTKISDVRYIAIGVRLQSG